METLHLDFFKSVFSLPACSLLDACNICCEELVQYNDCDDHDDANGDDDESNVDSRGKVRPSQIWGHFCCALDPPRSHDDDDDDDDDFDLGDNIWQ